RARCAARATTTRTGATRGASATTTRAARARCAATATATATATARGATGASSPAGGVIFVRAHVDTRAFGSRDEVEIVVGRGRRAPRIDAGAACGQMVIRHLVGCR